jgi:hypothetical protein
MMAQKEQKLVEDDNNNMHKLTMCILLDSNFVIA